MGQLSRTKLQLHDSLAIMVEGIQIIDGAADRMSIILGKDVFYSRGRFLGLRCLEERGHQTVVNVKVTRTGVMYMLIAAEI